MDKQALDREYTEFVSKFGQKIQEIRNDFSELSIENQRRFRLDAENFIKSIGIAGLLQKIRNGF